MKLHSQWRTLVVLATFLVVATFFFTRPVMIQNQSYHQFIDTRSFFGIPNAMDVLSNVLFALVGFLGIQEVAIRQPALVTKKSWFWFFLSVLLIAPGSAYYHLSPNDATLVWDRLPMSGAFMALYVVLLSEHMTLKSEKYLFPALMFGVLSVVTWVITTDLRFYIMVQYGSFVTIPLILMLFPSRFTLKFYYFIILVMYGLAKWAEAKDQKIYEISSALISGHTLKHVLAALGLLALWWMVRTRSDEGERLNS